GDADQAVHDPAGRVRRAEVLAEDPGHEVELSDRHQTPVEPTDNEQGPGEYIELAHYCLPPVEILSKIATIRICPGLVKGLSSSCIVLPWPAPERSCGSAS